MIQIQAIEDILLNTSLINIFELIFDLNINGSEMKFIENSNEMNSLKNKFIPGTLCFPKTMPWFFQPILHVTYQFGNMPEKIKYKLLLWKFFFRRCIFFMSPVWKIVSNVKYNIWMLMSIHSFSSSCKIVSLDKETVKMISSIQLNQTVTNLYGMQNNFVGIKKKYVIFIFHSENIYFPTLLFSRETNMNRIFHNNNIFPCSFNKNKKIIRSLRIRHFVSFNLFSWIIDPIKLKLEKSKIPRIFKSY